jgi:hypothetical protein
LASDRCHRLHTRNARSTTVPRRRLESKKRRKPLRGCVLDPLSHSTAYRLLTAVPRRWQLEQEQASRADRLAVAGRLKEKGNSLFKQGQYEEAREAYIKVPLCFGARVCVLW